MHYQKRLIFSYATVVFLLSIVMGAIFFRINYESQSDRMEQSMKTESDQILLEIEDRLERMDEIIRYLLSDQETLESINILSKVSDGKIPITYLANAKQSVYHRMNSDFIYKNAYRVVYYNPGGIVISSYNWDDHRDRTAEMESKKDPELTYLHQADGTKGGTVTIGAHADVWGGEDGPAVVSRVKKIQGDRLGYLEVELRVDDFRKIQPSDNSLVYIAKSGEDSLYQSSELPDGEFKQVVSESRTYGIRVTTFRSMEDIREETVMLIYSAVLLSFVVFLISLFFVAVWSYYLAKPIIRLKQIVEETSLETLSDNMNPESFLNSSQEVRQLAVSFSSLRERLDRAIRDEKRASLLQMQAQFDTLQAQVNPHFIYNVLNIISSKGILSDDESISNMCDALAQMLRYSTGNRVRYAKVEQELEYLEKYLYLIRERYPQRLETDIQIAPELYDKIIPKMALQELVENSVNHGLKNTSEKMKISVCGEGTEHGWRISVRDNGSGFEEAIYNKILEELSRTKNSILNQSMTPEMEIGGMGLINTYARCLILYHGNAVFKIENGVEGVAVTIGEEQ